MGRTNRRLPITYRPELHDSNGLSIHAGNGEWIWRPLNNPKHLAVSSFSMENPQGFGLLQRGRHFSRFEDLDTKIVRSSSKRMGDSERGVG
ncbi:glucan biosynthesis protein [Escherichia coli]